MINLLSTQVSQDVLFGHTDKECKRESARMKETLTRSSDYASNRFLTLTFTRFLCSVRQDRDQIALCTHMPESSLNLV